MNNDELDQTIATNLKWLMKNNRHLGSQGLLAKKSGVGQTTISRVLNTENSPTTETLTGLATAFGITVAQLIDPSLILQGIGIPEGRALPLIPWEDIPIYHSNPEIYEVKEGIFCPFESSVGSFAAVVKGDTMYSTYLDGSYICIEPRIEAVNGNDIILLTKENKVIFRQLQRTSEGDFLSALNPEWPNKLIERPAESEICGVVTSTWTLTTKTP